MACWQCGKRNTRGRKFCAACGAAFGSTCLWCGSCSKPGDASCRGCKAPLPESDSAPSREAECLSPQSFAAGRYQVVRLLRESDFERVYLAHDTNLGRKVAVSLITPAGLDETGRRHIGDLARSTAKLSGHPHIVTVHEVGEENGRPYIVSEYLGLGSLEDLLSKSPDHRIPVPDATRIGEEMCKALEYAHAHGVIHGGLSPASVLIAPGGSVKLAGFGFGLPLAVYLSRAIGKSVAFGSVAYLSPEQILGGPPAARSDLYSVGAVLYEAVTGCVPFSEDGPGHPLAQQLAVEPVSPAQRVADCPAALDGLIRSLLRKSADSRPPTATVAREHLQTIGDLLRTRLMVPQRPWAEPAPAPMERIRRRIPAVPGAGTFAGEMLSVMSSPVQLTFAVIGLLLMLSAGSALILSRHSGVGLGLMERLGAGAGLEVAQSKPERHEMSAKNATNRGGKLGDSGVSLKPGESTKSAGPNPDRELLALASEGNAEAQTALGSMYLRGEGAPKDYAEALHWLREGASRGDAQAQARLGYMYASGVGVAADYGEAARWFQKAAAQDDPDAQYDLAVMYEQGRGLSIDRSEALRWFRRSAAQDNVRAQYELGRRYLEGDGVSQDYGRALQWLRKAADQGNIPAQNALGYLYEQGRGVSQSYVQAVHWYRKAADQGDAKAQLNLGLMYEAGQSLLQDYAAALDWYRKAAAQGDAYAQTSIGVMYCKGEGVKQDYVAARDWFGRAATLGEPKAQYNLGVMYDTGMGVTRDYAEAARWYRKAAEQGNVDAEYNLGYLYEHGQGTLRDYTEALRWYHKAAGRGDTLALEKVRNLESK